MSAILSNSSYDQARKSSDNMDSPGVICTDFRRNDAASSTETSSCSLTSTNLSRSTELPAPPTLPDCCTSVFRAVQASHMSCLVRYPTSLLMEVDVDGKTVLHVAARYGDMRIIGYLLDEAPTLIDVESRLRETPLHIAVAYGQTSAIERFLEGPHTEAMRRALSKDLNGTTSLMATVARSDNDVALWLLRRFGRELAMEPNNCHMLPIHVAAANGNLEFLRIVTKYDNRMVNYRDDFGCTPCVYAAQGGCLNCFRYLVEKARADLTVLSNKGQSVVHVAALTGHAHIVRWLLYQIGPEALLWPTFDQSNAIHCASFGGHTEILKMLLEPWSKKRRRSILTLRDGRGNTPLHLAVINNHADAVHYLLGAGADPKLLNNCNRDAEAIAHLRDNDVLARFISEHSSKKKSKKSSKKPKLKSQSTAGMEALGLNRSSSAMVYTESVSGHASPGVLTRVYSPTARSSIELSSGYSSGGELLAHGWSPTSLSAVPNHGSSRTRAESSTQTDRVQNADEWHGAAIAAVEEIDRVLKHHEG